MTEKPEASVLTARRAAQHFRLSSADDACEHLYILIVRSSLGPSPPNAGRYTVASRFRRRSCERGYIFPRAPEQFVTSPLCLVGYVRWDARSDRVPPSRQSFSAAFQVARRVADHTGVTARGSNRNPEFARLAQNEAAGCTMRTARELKMEIPARDPILPDFQNGLPPRRLRP